VTLTKIERGLVGTVSAELCPHVLLPKITQFLRFGFLFPLDVTSITSSRFQRRADTNVSDCNDDFSRGFVPLIRG
jgi:hypothetical protein